MDSKELLQKVTGRIRRFGLKEWGMVLVTGICLMVLALPAKHTEGENAEDYPSSQNAGNRSEEEREDTVENSTEQYARGLEKRLEELLLQVEGIEDARVMIMVKETREQVVLKDSKAEHESSMEQDSAGGSRVVENSRQEGSTVLVEENGTDIPYVVKEVYPEVEGVVVIVNGKGTETTDLDILTAVQVLFGVPAHKIKIMKMKTLGQNGG